MVFILSLVIDALINVSTHKASWLSFVIDAITYTSIQEIFHENLSEFLKQMYQKILEEMFHQYYMDGDFCRGVCNRIKGLTSQGGNKMNYLCMIS